MGLLTGSQSVGRGKGLFYDYLISLSHNYIIRIDNAPCKGSAHAFGILIRSLNMGALWGGLLVGRLSVGRLMFSYASLGSSI